MTRDFRSFSTYRRIYATEPRIRLKPVWKELFIRLTVRIFRGRWSNFVCVLLVFRVGMWDVIVLIPDHCLSIYFASSGIEPRTALSACQRLTH